MLRRLIEVRMLIAMAIAAGVGTGGLRAFPIGSDQVFLAVIEARPPGAYRRARLWICRALVLHTVLDRVHDRLARHDRRLQDHHSSAVPRTSSVPTARDEASAITRMLGEAHHATRPGRAPEPTWLTIPQRGLYTGLMVLGAVGTGKTCPHVIYPYVDQLLRWRRDDANRKVGGLVMEVKGDFCRQVHAILRDAQRGDDYVEIGLNPASATTRCTTISIRTPSPTRSPLY